MIIRDTGRWIEIVQPGSRRDALRAIPGIRFDALSGAWRLPATAGYLERVLEIVSPADTVDCAGLRAVLDRRRAGRDTSGAPLAMPAALKTSPRRHQVGAVRFGVASDAALYHIHMSGGKTYVALATCALREHRRVLVLCPKAVIRVWSHEVKKHGPSGMQVAALNEGSVAERDRITRLMLDRVHGAPVMVVANYEAAWHDPLSKTILRTAWDCLILDESSKIKAPGGKASRFCALIPAKQRLALTGTPMPHSPLDIYAQYRALDPGIFGTSFQLFKARYAVMGGYQNYQVVGWRNQEDLKRRMDTIRYEVKAEDLDLPPMEVVDVPVTLGDQARRHYRELENLFITNVKSGAVTASNALSKLLRLQQVTCGFLPVQGISGETLRLEEIGTEKREALTELLEEAAGEPVVVFCRFKHDLAAVRAAAEALGLRAGELSGSANDMVRWDAGEVDVMAVQVQAGGMGIDLTRARYGIYFSMIFSLGEYDQSLARLRRTNQTRPVTIYRLTAEKTVDEKICKALDAKREVIEAILQEAFAPAEGE